jgi:hypothetical protein
VDNNCATPSVTSPATAAELYRHARARAWINIVWKYWATNTPTTPTATARSNTPAGGCFDVLGRW